MTWIAYGQEGPGATDCMGITTLIGVGSLDPVEVLNPQSGTVKQHYIGIAPIDATICRTDSTTPATVLEGTTKMIQANPGPVAPGVEFPGNAGWINAGTKPVPHLWWGLGVKPKTPPTTLLNGLVSYWPLNEASGNALDSHGVNHLTDTNTVGSGAGKIGNARDFDKPSSEHFTRTSGADLTTGDIDFTFAAWVKIETATSHTVLAKWSAQAEFFISIDSSRQVFFRVNTPGGQVVVSSLTFAVVVGTWAHIVVWHDSVADQLGITVNNGTARLSACSGGLLAFPAIAFKIGLTESGYNEPFNGMIDEVGFWKRMLTPAERTELYNSGNGKTYPFT